MGLGSKTVKESGRGAQCAYTGKVFERDRKWKVGQTRVEERIWWYHGYGRLDRTAFSSKLDLDGELNFNR